MCVQQKFIMIFRQRVMVLFHSSAWIVCRKFLFHNVGRWKYEKEKENTKTTGCFWLKFIAFQNSIFSYSAILYIIAMFLLNYIMDYISNYFSQVSTVYCSILNCLTKEIKWKMQDTSRNWVHHFVISVLVLLKPLWSLVFKFLGTEVVPLMCLILLLVLRHAQIFFWSHFTAQLNALIIVFFLFLSPFQKKK